MKGSVSTLGIHTLAIAVTGIAFAACGGGGSGGGTTNCGLCGGPVTLTVSGDMIAYQTNRGWNYQGSGFGTTATVSVYADPPQNGADVLVGFAQQGLVANAFGGTKFAALGLQPSGGGYNATSYVLLNIDGSVYAQGALAGSPTLVPQTLVQGQGFATYPGVTAIVQTVGTVPGSNACPTPATGATVQYSFAGSSYSVSYVPGCGITQYVGNRGETLTLVSVGSYPQLGTQSVRRLDSLRVMDSLVSAARIVLTHATWRQFPR